jgi:DNA repair protein NreA
MSYWKKTIEAAKDFTGTSPPSVFVGRAFYPKVFVGILSPPQHSENAQQLDSPELWYKQNASIQDILQTRGQLIYSRFKSDVNNFKGKLMEATQEVAMTKKPVDVEVELMRSPTFRMRFDMHSTPIANPAPIIKARLTENPSVERRVDYLVSDVDIHAENSVIALYNYGLPVSRIQKIFSAGLLGVQMQRKLVPTKWGITAVDDIIGKNLREKVKAFQELSEVLVFKNEYIGNNYQILLIPSSYEFELVEIWNLYGRHMIDSDYEPYLGKKEYANKTAGAFYSGRLAVLEHLNKIKRQAGILIIREVRSDYFAPVGIWQMREAVRGAFSKPCEGFVSVEEAVKAISLRIISKDEWTRESTILKNKKTQTKLTKFYRFK